MTPIHDISMTENISGAYITVYDKTLRLEQNFFQFQRFLVFSKNEIRDF